MAKASSLGADVRFVQPRVLAIPLCLLLLVLFSEVPVRTAGEVSGPFQLQGGRDARRELAFAVHQPG
ncbi:MAG TPA: hypothetical protein VMZ90_12580, partial [Vicinamibacterales bacterium]|nr:hypothetical protein [Vicinamibacterales bacterium]